MEPGHYLPNDVVGLVIRAYEEAYETSQRDLSPTEGDDGFVFGVMVWRRAVARLAYYAERYGVQFTRRNNHIELRLPNGTLRPYPGGKNPLDDTAKLPFRTDSKAKEDLVTDNTEQLSLFAEYPRVRIVLLHVGDAVRGLRELWVGVPYYDENEQLVGWESPERIYSSNTILQESLDHQPLQKFPPFSERQIPDIDMGLRRKVEEDDIRDQSSD